MGQLWSNQSGSLKAYWIPGFVPDDPMSQGTALAIAQGARTPEDIAFKAAENIGRTLVGGLIVGVVFLLVWYIWFRPNHPFIFTKKKESFEPREEADESWVRIQ